jgi:hypothetical protein
MRLLDRVAHCRSPLTLAIDGSPRASVEVAGPSRFAVRVAQCPLRFVLGDDLTRASAELAFADGARVGGCLDLLRAPATELWLEWSDAVYQRVIDETESASDLDATASGRRVGILLHASADGLRAVGRTFWASASNGDEGEVTLSPLETHIDLGAGFSDLNDRVGILSGGFAGVTDRNDPAMASILDHVRFRFEDSWLRYYNAAAATPEAKHSVIYGSLAAIARDTPFLLAFILLLTAKDATRTTPISRVAINRKRAANGHAPLLDHVEVHASLDDLQQGESSGLDIMGRQSPRLHHVRGHLVRRDQRVFWRVPHLRGSASRGMVHSRTVCLSFARGHEAEARL